MERHLQTARKLTSLIGGATLCLFLGACGGGGGGGDGGDAQANGAADVDTAGAPTTGSNAAARSGSRQNAGIFTQDAGETIATNTDAPAQQLGSASLSWRAPTQRVDGASLSVSEIAGYRIYYGTRSGRYDSTLSVDDPYTFAILIDDLPVGTYYFVMTTVDTNGLESGYSGEAVKSVLS